MYQFNLNHPELNQVLSLDADDDPRALSVRGQTIGQRLAQAYQEEPALKETLSRLLDLFSAIPNSRIEIGSLPTYTTYKEQKKANKVVIGARINIILNGNADYTLHYNNKTIPMLINRNRQSFVDAKLIELGDQRIPIPANYHLTSQWNIFATTLLNIYGISFDSVIPDSNSLMINEGVLPILEPGGSEGEPTMAVTQKFSLNTILYGPPGTGKTFNTVNRALDIIANEEAELADKIKKYKDKDDRAEIKKLFDLYSGVILEEGSEDNDVDNAQIGFVTFHPSYSYEDFVVGLKPELVAGTNEGEPNVIDYKAKPGIFLEMCKRAQKFEHKNYVLIIDEINRGDLASIFGELMTVIEDSKRLGEDEQLKVELPHQPEKFPLLFGVPRNLYIIGTMNTADRSATSMDIALRRRFDFEYQGPELDENGFLDFDVENLNLRELIKTINNKIEALLEHRDHIIGHAFFWKVKQALENKGSKLTEAKAKEKAVSELQRAFKQKVLPLLEEYFHEDWSDIQNVMGNVIVENYPLSGTAKSTYRLNDELLSSGKQYEFLAELIKLVVK